AAIWDLPPLPTHTNKTFGMLLMMTLSPCEMWWAPWDLRERASGLTAAGRRQDQPALAPRWVDQPCRLMLGRRSPRRWRGKHRQRARTDYLRLSKILAQTA